MYGMLFQHCYASSNVGLVTVALIKKQSFGRQLISIVTILVCKTLIRYWKKYCLLVLASVELSLNGGKGRWTLHCSPTEEVFCAAPSFHSCLCREAADVALGLFVCVFATPHVASTLYEFYGKVISYRFWFFCIKDIYCYFSQHLNFYKQNSNWLVRIGCFSISIDPTNNKMTSANAARHSILYTFVVTIGHLTDLYFSVVFLPSP